MHARVRAHMTILERGPFVTTTRLSVTAQVISVSFGKHFATGSFPSTVVPRKSGEAMAFQVEFVECASLTAPHLNSPVLVNVARDDDGHAKFFEARACHKTARLLCTDGHSQWDRAFKTVTVLDKIKELRDEKYRDDEASGIKIQKGVNPSKSVKAKAITRDGTVITVDVPSIADMPARAVRLIMDPPKTAVRIELTASNLQWLSDVIAAERAAGVGKRVAPAVEVTELRQLRENEGLEKNTLWVTKGVCRAMRPANPDEPDNKKVCTTFLSIDKENPASTFEAAKAFIAGDTALRKGGSKRKLTQRSLHDMFGAGKSSDTSSSFDANFETSSIAESVDA